MPTGISNQQLENRRNIVFDYQTDCMYYLCKIAIEKGLACMFNQQELNDCVLELYGLHADEYDVWDWNPCRVS